MNTTLSHTIDNPPHIHNYSRHARQQHIHISIDQSTRANVCMQYSYSITHTVVPIFLNTESKLCFLLLQFASHTALASTIALRLLVASASTATTPHERTREARGYQPAAMGSAVALPLERDDICCEGKRMDCDAARKDESTAVNQLLIQTFSTGAPVAACWPQESRTSTATVNAAAVLSTAQATRNIRAPRI